MTSVSFATAVQCFTSVLQDVVTAVFHNDTPLTELTAGDFVTWLEGQGISACEVHSKYNALLMQRGLIDKQIPSGANPVMPGDQQSPIIARPDLYLQAYEEVCVQRGRDSSLATFPHRISTGTCFLSLHHANLSHHAPIRGAIHHRYNELLAQSLGNGYCAIPGNDHETLDLSGWNQNYPAVVVNPILYFQAMREILKKYENVQPTASIQTSQELRATIHDIPGELFHLFFEQLNPRDLARVMRVCREWRAWCGDVPIPKSIEQVFPKHVGRGPVFWNTLLGKKSVHPESIGQFQDELISAYLARKSEQLKAKAEDLIAKAATCSADSAAAVNPKEQNDLKIQAEELESQAGMLQRQARGYTLNYGGTWTMAQVQSLHQMIGSVQVEDEVGFSYVVMPEDCSLNLLIDIMRAMGAAKGCRGDTPGFYAVDDDILAQCGDVPSGPTTLIMLTNGFVLGTRGKRIAECETIVAGLNCQLLELLPLALHCSMHAIERKGGPFWYGNDPHYQPMSSFVQERLIHFREDPIVIGGAINSHGSSAGRVIIGDSPKGQGPRIGAGAQRKFQTKKST